MQRFVKCLLIVLLVTAGCSDTAPAHDKPGKGSPPVQECPVPEPCPVCPDPCPPILGEYPLTATLEEKCDWLCATADDPTRVVPPDPAWAGGAVCVCVYGENCVANGLPQDECGDCNVVLD